MALTRDFKETIQIRIKRDPTFREEMLKEGVECLLAGDMATGKAVLRDYINAAIGFQELAKLTAKSPKSLMRMFGPNGNPQARNLFEILGFLQQREGLHLKVHTLHCGKGNRLALGALGRNHRPMRRSGRQLARAHAADSGAAGVSDLRPRSPADAMPRVGNWRHRTAAPAISFAPWPGSARTKSRTG